MRQASPNEAMAQSHAFESAASAKIALDAAQAAQTAARHAEAATADPLGTRTGRLMYGLFYPAVLGTAFVGIATRMTKVGVEDFLGDPVLHVAILFVIFFAGSFAPPKPRKYPVIAFWFDVIETCAMFAAFFFLGLFVTQNGAYVPKPWKIPAAELLLIGVIWLHVPWDRAANPGCKQSHGLRLIATCLLILDGGLLYGNLEGDGQNALHIAILIGVTIAMVAYNVGDDWPRRARAGAA